MKRTAYDELKISQLLSTFYRLNNYAILALARTKDGCDSETVIGAGVMAIATEIKHK